MSYARRFFPHFWISTTSPPALTSTALAALAAVSTPSSPRAGSRMKITSYDRTLLTSLFCSESFVVSSRRIRAGSRANVELIHRGRRSLENQAAHRVGSPCHRVGQHRSLLRLKIGQDAIDRVLTGLGSADADTNASEFCAPERLLDGANSSM